MGSLQREQLNERETRLLETISATRQGVGSASRQSHGTARQHRRHVARRDHVPDEVSESDVAGNRLKRHDFPPKTISITVYSKTIYSADKNKKKV